MGENSKIMLNSLFFKDEILNQIMCIFLENMVLEWREREHEIMDHAALESAAVIQALRTCGLLKLFCTSPMRSNVHLLEFMVNYWDHDMEMFNLQGETLELTVEDIYFITGLSQRGVLSHEFVSFNFVF